MPILSADASLAPGSSVPAEAVSPGPVGFLWTGIVVAIVILLALDMVRRLRRTRYRGMVREQLEAEAAAQSAESGRTAGVAAKVAADASSHPSSGAETRVAPPSKQQDPASATPADQDRS